MFSPQLKKEISQKVQDVLQTIEHPELPKGKIKFILHVDGAEGWSWANIVDNDSVGIEVPPSIDRNLTA